MPAVLSSCPVCQSEQISENYVGRTTRQPDDPARWSVWRCDACGHGFVNPQPTWDELDAYYSASYSPYAAAHGVADLAETIEAAKASGTHRHVSIRPGMRVLDVGCGGGSFLQVAAAIGAEVFGVEPSEHGVKNARAAGLDVFHGTVEQFVEGRGADAEKFDLITLSHVLEHTPDPVETLGRLRRVLAEGGMLWLAVPNAACRPAQLLQDRWHSTDLPIHLMQFTPASLEKCCRAAGLQVSRLYTYTLPKAAVSSFRLVCRHRFFLPGRLLMPLQPLWRHAVLRRAARADAANAGEAILVELAPS